MKRLTTLVALLLGAVLLLSACDITVTPAPQPPRTPDDRVTANTDPEESLATLNIQPGRDMLIQIDVPQAVREFGPLIYIELDGNLNLQLQSAARSPVAYSNSAAYFSRNPIGSNSTALDPHAITIQTTCRGSCVILQPGGDSRYYALVTNNSGSPATVDLYAFADVFTDSYEPANNRTDSAPSLLVGTTLDESGAIETIGDEDYWYAQYAGAVRFRASNAALNLRAVITDSSGAARGQTYSPGSVINLAVGDFLKIWSASDRAAASASSVYYLETP